MAVEVRGDSCPIARTRHSAVQHDKYIYIFGGINNDRFLLSDMWSFNTSKGFLLVRLTVGVFNNGGGVQGVESGAR